MPTAYCRLLTCWTLRAALLIGLVLLVVATESAPLLAQSRPEVHVVQIEGTITPVTARYIDRAIRDAERDDAAALVIEVNTPGGLGSAMDDIVEDILASDVPVIVYVAPSGARSASAGVFITYAAHLAAMAPGTNIGSASPVFVGSDGSTSDGDETMARKATNDAAARIRNLANLRGRNAEWAERAVREADNITADEALNLGVIDLIAPDLETLLTQIDGRTVITAAGPVTLQTAGAETSAFEMSFMERFLQVLSEPTIAYLLMSFGLLGIYVELSNPGLGVPGIGGGLALLLGLLGLGSLPFEWVGLALIVLGFVLILVDIFVTSLGILTVGGLVSFVIGSNLLLDDGLPEGFQISQTAILTVTACLAVFAALIGLLAVRGQLRRPATGQAALIGAVGEVRESLAPEGMVHVAGELWRARLAEPVTGPVEHGERVVVTAVRGLVIEVRPFTKDESEPAVQVGDRYRVLAGEPTAAPHGV